MFIWWLDANQGLASAKGGENIFELFFFSGLLDTPMICWVSEAECSLPI